MNTPHATSVNVTSRAINAGTRRSGPQGGRGGRPPDFGRRRRGKRRTGLSGLRIPDGRAIGGDAILLIFLATALLRFGHVRGRLARGWNVLVGSVDEGRHIVEGHLLTVEPTRARTLDFPAADRAHLRTDPQRLLENRLAGIGGVDRAADSIALPRGAQGPIAPPLGAGVHRRGGQ